jgi:hypothetical protein
VGKISKSSTKNVAAKFHHGSRSLWDSAMKWLGE